MENDMRKLIDQVKNFIIKENVNNDFIAFKGVSKDFKPHDGPMFFTSDEDGAKYYAERMSGYVIKALIKFKNPLIVDAYKPAPIPIIHNGELIGNFSEKDINDKIKSAGFDGLIINKKFGNELDGWEILSFDNTTREFL